MSFAFVVAGLGVLLTLPSLWVGWLIDDYYLRWAVVGSNAFGGLRPRPLNMFGFLDGEAHRTEQMKAIGLVPWWTYPRIRADFWKPVTAVTHILDYRLWPESPALMHAQSLFWFVLLVLSVSLLYQRIMRATVAAGLAMLLFAIDDCHAVPVAWLANRNSVLAALFGVLAIRAHLEWRRRNRTLLGIAAPIFLALSLLSAEAGIGTVGYLVAFAVVLERGTWIQRFLSLLPCFLVVVVWRIVWSALGHGVVGMEGLYTDPVADPIRLAGMVFERFPILMLGQWGEPPANVHMILSSRGVAWMCLAGVMMLLILFAVMWPLLKRSSIARFWAAGMVFAAIPICWATPPQNRNLIFVSIGAMGLLGQFFASILRRSFWNRFSLGGRLGRGAVVGGLVLVHLIISPLALAIQSRYPLGPAKLLASFHAIPELTAEDGERDLIIVNHPLPADVAHLLTDRAVDGRPLPRSTMVLAPATSRLTIERVDSNSLRLTLEGGYFSTITSSLLFSRNHPMVRGDVFEVPAATVTVQSVTEDGRPLQVLFRFRVSLEDHSLNWICWESRHFVRFVPPEVGATTVLEGSGLPI